ncbi:MAG TPA: hypothetical protein DDW50_20240 [Firmicutes bacterium]|jgi:hypothetical protein|nr:hypothetical protein [Bacillota bacterium]
MDYIHETKEILKEIFCTSWMDDNKIDDIIDETLKASGTTIEDLANVIETAVKNGHSIKEQKEILSEILT